MNVYLELMGSPVSSLRCIHRRSSGSNPQWDTVLTG